MPQPDWMGEFAVDIELAKADNGSTLGMYRKALKLRRELQTKEELIWIGGDTDQNEVLHFKRDGGWEVMMNFNGEGVVLPKGEDGMEVEVLVVSSQEGLGEGGEVPKNTTVWFRR